MGFCFSPMMGIFSRFTILLLFLLSCFTSTEAFDTLDPDGNITVKWDIMNWTADGYSAVVTIYNFQRYRHIQAPGWSLGWTWKEEDFIWSMRGGQVTEQGNCSKFKKNIPFCCQKSPTIVDLLPGAPYNQQIANCCKGGVLSAWMQDPANATASFQLSVGAAGTSNRTVKVPGNFSLKTPPETAYSCGAAQVIADTKFLRAQGSRVTEALMTWIVTCAYSEFQHQQPYQQSSAANNQFTLLVAFTLVLTCILLMPQIRCFSYRCF